MCNYVSGERDGRAERRTMLVVEGTRLKYGLFCRSDDYSTPALGWENLLHEQDKRRTIRGRWACYIVARGGLLSHI
jgi:hypothetical protein